MAAGRNVSLLHFRLSGGVDGNRNAETPPEERQCWICLATEEEIPGAIWLHPCRCRGTNKWVHETCLGRWIDEKQLGNMDVAVVCTQCRTEYIIVVPSAGRLDGLLEYIDKNYERICPTMVVGVVLATIYFSAVTYGALTVLQVAGYERGMQLLSEGYPPLLLVGLPAIPVMLLMGRMITWDDMIINYLRNRRTQRERQSFAHRRVTLADDDSAGGSPGAPLEENYFDRMERDYPTIDGTRGTHGAERIVRASRNFVGALILPTCAVFVGRMLFESFENRLHRALLGGLTFIGIKGMANIYLRQCKYARRRERVVLDYTAANVRRYEQLARDEQMRR